MTMKKRITDHCNRANLIERYQCYVTVMSEVLIKDGEEDAWSKYELELKNHIKTWEKCPTFRYA